MDTLDVEDGFSVHEHRSGLKLLEQGRTTMTFENREPYACPVCGELFERLLVAADGEHAFQSGFPDPVCLVATEGTLVVATH